MDIAFVELCLLVAAVVAMVARRLYMPYTVGLLAAGLLLSLAPGLPEVHLTKHVIFMAFLPPLVFEAAINLEWRALRRELLLVGVLATVGVVIAAAVAALGMRYLAGWGWRAALLFAALIAATDPVSVVAAMKEAGLKGRFRLLVESESLLNDGTAAVLFAVILAAFAGEAAGPAGVAWLFAKTVVGGVLCGALVAGVVLLLSGGTEDHLVELALTTVAAYGSFLLAEHFGLSGVLATMTAGLMVGNLSRRGVLSPRGNEAVFAFWEFAAFIINSLVFLLLGVAEAHRPFSAVPVAIAAAIALTLAGRLLAVVVCCAPFARSRVAVPRREQMLLVWGGLRGALGLALALGLPADLPGRDEVITVTFAVVAFSVVVQGTSINPLLRQSAVGSRQSGDE